MRIIFRLYPTLKDVDGFVPTFEYIYRLGTFSSF